MAPKSPVDRPSAAARESQGNPGYYEASFFPTLTPKRRGVVFFVE